MMNKNEENITKCKNCGKIISDDELKIVTEILGENLGKEEIVIGYCCTDCVMKKIIKNKLVTQNETFK